MTLKLKTVQPIILPIKQVKTSLSYSFVWLRKCKNITLNYLVTGGKVSRIGVKKHSSINSADDKLVSSNKIISILIGLSFQSSDLKLSAHKYVIAHVQACGNL